MTDRTNSVSKNSHFARLYVMLESCNSVRDCWIWSLCSSCVDQSIMILSNWIRANSFLKILEKDARRQFKRLRGCFPSRIHSENTEKAAVRPERLLVVLFYKTFDLPYAVFAPMSKVLQRFLGSGYICPCPFQVKISDLHCIQLSIFDAEVQCTVFLQPYPNWWNPLRKDRAQFRPCRAFRQSLALVIL